MATVRKLVVEVVDARSLLPKDGHGASSPYAILDYNGQRRKTRTIIRDLNPTWNDILEFNADKTSDVFGDMLELNVFHDVKIGPTTRSNFLGRVRLSSRQFVRKGEEALIYYPLEKKHLFSWVQGEIGLKIYLLDELLVPPPEVKPDTTPPPEVKSDPAPETAEPAPPPEVKSDPAPETTERPPPPDVNCDPAPEEDERTPCPANEKSGNSVPLVADGEKPSTENPTAENASAPVSQGETPFPDQTPKQSLPYQNPDLVQAQMTPGFAREVKINSLNNPQPMSRVSSLSSFASDLTDRSTVERSSYDLVDKMHYIFVHIVKVRSIPAAGAPVVKIAVSGHHAISRPGRRAAAFEWDQTFAFGRGDSPDSSAVLEVSLWDPGVVGGGFLGGICFDVGEIPLRDPPDSSLAPQWYRLEGEGAHHGDLMLAAWIGTQADESFADAWKADMDGGPTSRSKVYQSPKLWYLRLSVIEAQDLPAHIPVKESSYQINAQLGFQVQRTKSAVSTTGAPSWNEDLMFVAAEPLTEHITFFLLENRPRLKEPLVVGILRVPLMSIERRVDDRTVTPRWSTMEDPSEEKHGYRGRVHLRLCFDGGYHVMDEGAHVCSDYRPTARQLWKPPVGTIELGIIGCRNLIPTKTASGGKGSADTYVVVKYGGKWVRTRTISDSLDPKWNEQYTWRVYDPSTVLTLGVFDSWELIGSREPAQPDSCIGRVRIRMSTLTTGRAYRTTFPLLLLSRAGLRKVGEIELAVRLTRTVHTLDLVHLYSQPLMPAMHYLKPLGNIAQQETLRSAAVKMISAYLSRSEPPLRPEVVAHVLDSSSNTFSMRKVRANWFRIVNAIAGVIELFKWVEETRSWRNPTATMLVHALLVILVWFPDLIVPTIAFYVFAVGAWNYRLRPKSMLPHFDPKLSLAESVDREELEEEFDSVMSMAPSEAVRVRYNRLRVLGARAQVLLGDVADQGERVQALVTWRDPRATGIFVGLCLVVAFVLYLVPPKMVAVACGFYYMRHPIFRDRMPSPAVNFFRRLPSLADRML